MRDASDTSEDWKAFLHRHCSSAPIGRFTGKPSKFKGQAASKQEIKKKGTGKRKAAAGKASTRVKSSQKTSRQKRS